MRWGICLSELVAWSLAYPPRNRRASFYSVISRRTRRGCLPLPMRELPAMSLRVKEQLSELARLTDDLSRREHLLDHSGTPAQPEPRVLTIGNRCVLRASTLASAYECQRRYKNTADFIQRRFELSTKTFQYLTTTCPMCASESCTGHDTGSQNALILKKNPPKRLLSQDKSMHQVWRALIPAP